MGHWHLTFAWNVRRRADETSLTLALVTTLYVGTNGRRSARVRRAFVHVLADCADGFEAVLAETLALDALGIVDAVKVRFTQCRYVGLQQYLPNR